MVDRRLLLAGAGAAALIVALRWLGDGDVATAGSFEIEKSDSEWRRILTKPQYEVLRLHRTEVPGSSPLNHESRKGTFTCAGCELPLFSSETKYDSKTGWPSFYRPSPAAAAHRGALPPLRRAPRPRVRGRAAADRLALLHQRRRLEVRARRSGLMATSPRRTNGATTDRFHG
jgi:hypothetical protein